MLFHKFQQQFSSLKIAISIFFVLSINVLLVSTSAHASAVNTPLKFTQLSINEGLSQSYAYSITQDKNGFIWVATEDGLNKYDGQNFVHYRHDINNPHSIADNFVRALFIDNEDTLWVGTQNGLSRYNEALDNFDNYYSSDEPNSLKDNEIWAIYQSDQLLSQAEKNENHERPLLISTKVGLHTFNYKNNNFTAINARNDNDRAKEPLTEIKTIFQDNNLRYWIGTYDNGIFILNKKLTYAYSLQSENQWALNINAQALYDLKLIDNNYWLATNNGVYVVDQNYKIIKHYTNDSPQNALLSNNVRSIEKFDDNYVWLGTQEGLEVINLANNNITHHRSKEHPRAISENWIMDIFKDDLGNFWLGTYGQGVNFLNPQSSLFQHYLFDFENTMIESFAETANKFVWFSQKKEGIKSLSPDGTITPLKISLDDDIYEMQPGSNNELWVTTFDGELFNIDTTSQVATPHKKWAKLADYNRDYLFINIADELWYIDNNGSLTSYNTISQEFQRFSSNNNSFKSLSAENELYLWLVSSNNELTKFNLEKRAFTESSISLKESLTIGNINNFSITTNWIWLATEQGVTLLNRQNKKTTIFNENNHLANNFITAILIDESDNAWFATNRSISVINPKTKKVKNFGKGFDLSDNEFIQSSALKASDGLLYFGGVNGFHRFDPNDILKIEQTIYQPILTDVLVANKKIHVSNEITKSVNDDESKFVLAEQVNFIKKLTLKYSQSPFSIEFISPNSKLPNQVGYRYRLNGLETSWIESGNNNHRATYTNLSSGDYTFAVQAYDLYNPSIVKTKSLDIHILPPWWLSKSAILVYTLLTLLVIIYLLQQMRHKRLYHLQIKQSEERLKLSLWGSGDEMWDWNIKTGKIYRSNIWGILEFPQDGRRNVGADKTNIHEQDIPRVREALNEHFDKNTEHFESTYRVKDKDDQWIWVLDRGKIVERDEKNSPTRMTGTLKDISQIKKAEERLKLFAKCIENISDAVVIYDRQFMAVDVNKAFQRITKKSKKEVVGTYLNFALYPDSFTQNVKKHLITKGSWHGEIESTRDNGNHYSTDLNIDIIRDENGNISHFVGVFSDITKRKETEIELRKLANSDTLTGLPNRSYFQANQSRLVKNKIPHALLVFDLDNFKKINDSMGHQIGDILLCKVAERILAIGRKQDTVYRLGGDEFSIIVENTNDIHTITSIAKEILRTIALPLKLRNQEVVLFSSIGIVLYPEDGVSPHELLKNADTAMYHAKNAGGNKYQFFNDSMNKQAVKRLQIENLIRHGLKEDLFSVFYQPKIEIATGKIAGMEALVRFETPKKGIISPLQFIPVSEETGQIIDIGEVVLRKACFATKKWVDAGLFDGRIAVNLSAVQFTQPNLVGLIAQILKESQLPAKYLELEITEGTVMDSPQKAIETMLQIRAMGIHLSLDDFGTGYSSLAYLKRFPLNTLKIDKAFVDDIEHSEQGRNMVATIVTIAHNLDLQVVAEGVETDLQLSFLSGLKCEQLQGYLYSKPLKMTDFHKYLISHKIANKSTTFN
ncbi:EAL domain-containing protein [Colwelliaceae bacterium 6471]